MLIEKKFLGQERFVSVTNIDIIIIIHQDNILQSTLREAAFIKSSFCYFCDQFESGDVWTFQTEADFRELWLKDKTLQVKIKSNYLCCVLTTHSQHQPILHRSGNAFNHNRTSTF